MHPSRPAPPERFADGCVAVADGVFVSSPNKGRLDCRLLAARKNASLEPIGSAFFGFGNPTACCMTPDYGLVAAYGAGEVVKFNLKSSRKQWVRRLDGCAGPRLCEVLEDGRIVLVFSEHALLLRHDGSQEELWAMPPSWDDSVYCAVLSACKRQLFLASSSGRGICLTTLSMRPEWNVDKLPDPDIVVPLEAEAGKQLFAVVETFGEVAVLDGANGRSISSGKIWPPPADVPGFATLGDEFADASLSAACFNVWGGDARLFVAFDDCILCVHPTSLSPIWALGSLTKSCGGGDTLTIDRMSVVPAPDDSGAGAKAGVVVAFGSEGTAVSVCAATGRLLSSRRRDVTSKADVPSGGEQAAASSGTKHARPNPMQAAQVQVAPALASRSGAASRDQGSVASRLAASKASRGESGDDDDSDAGDGDDDEVQEEVSRAVIVPAHLARQWGCGPLLERAGPGSPAVVAYMATCDNIGGYSEVFAVPGPRPPARPGALVRPADVVGDALADRPAPVDAKLVRSWRAPQTGWRPDELHVDSACGLAVLAAPEHGMEVWSLRTGIRLWFRNAKSLAFDRPVSCEARPLGQLKAAPAAAPVEVRAPRRAPAVAAASKGFSASSGRHVSLELEDLESPQSRRASSGLATSGAAQATAASRAATPGGAVAPEGELVPDATCIAVMAVAEGSGTLCIVLGESATRCFDAFTGEDLWSTIVCGPGVDTDHAFGMRLRDGSHVYAFLNNKGILHVVDARTGATRFCSDVGLSDDLYNAEASLTTGVIVLSDDSGRIFAVDVNGTGAVQWALEPFAWLEDQPSVRAMGGGAVLLHGSLNTPIGDREDPAVVFALDCVTGKLLWRSSSEWAEDTGTWSYDSSRQLWVRLRAGTRASWLAVDALTGQVRGAASLSGVGGVAQFANGPGVVGAIGEDGLTLMSSATLARLTPAPFNAPPSFTQVMLAGLRRESDDAAGSCSCCNSISGRSGPGFSPLCACTMCCRRLPYQLEADSSRGCCGCGCGSGSGANGKGKEADSVTHAIVIGGSAEVFIVDIGALLGPMRFGPGTDAAVVSRLGAAKLGDSDGGSPAPPRSAIEAAHRVLPALAQRRTVLLPCVVVSAMLLLRLVLFFQLLLFSLKPAAPPSLEETQSTLETAQSLGLPSLHPSMPLLVVALALALLAVVLCTSERIEGLKFTRPDSACWRILWTASRIYVTLIVSVAQIPIWKTLASVVVCDASPNSDWLRGVGETCFESAQHIAIMVAVAAVACVFVVFSVRLLLAKGQLERIELSGLCDDWSGDDRSPEPAQQLLSEASSVYQVCLVFIRVTLSVSSVLLTTQPTTFAIVLVSGSLVQLAVAICVPPFFSSEGNKLVVLEILALTFQNSMALAASLVLEGSTGPLDVGVATRMLEWSPLGLLATIVIAAGILARVPAIKPHWKPLLSIEAKPLADA
ncbi:hypothetical protein FNF27_01139 [Cafeteria roenbergensis]|uniref:Pyrrolo-quinoline quinone repeat domain-containing protein n=2 Tax=Cafeteria roenbergensis TaxID=33653 RepID=A0A5A8ENQ7_CAFRO|nr:hypothetical protein FNF27_01139 [Cafeteria roenbergensis]